MTISLHHEDRIRSGRSFKWGLFLGVVGGGTFGAGIELGIQYYLELVPLLDIRMIFVYTLFIISALLIIGAIRISDSIEAWTYLCELRQPSRNIAILIQGAQDEAKKIPAFESILKKFHTEVSEEENYMKLTIESIREFTKEIHRIRKSIKNLDGPILSHISAICDYPKKMQELYDHLKNNILDASVFKERKWSTKKKGDELQVSKSKGFLRSARIMNIVLHNNLNESISCPFICQVAVNTVSLKDFTEAKLALDYFFSEILSSENVFEYNLEDFLPQEHELIESIKVNIQQPLMEEIVQDLKVPILKEVGKITKLGKEIKKKIS